MYICEDCGCVFFAPQRAEERHGLSGPPYERIAVCPSCGQMGFSYAEKCCICDSATAEYNLEAGCCKRCAGELLRRHHEVLESHFSCEELNILNALLEAKPIFEG